MLVTLPNPKVNKHFRFKLYFAIAIMPFSAAASIMIPAVRGALLSRTATCASTIAFRHMSAGPGFDYVKVNFMNLFLANLTFMSLNVNVIGWNNLTELLPI